MSLQERTAADLLRQAREQHVARGVATPALTVARASGPRIWDADGREYLDFAGGIGCQNLGHGHPGVVGAIRAQLDEYLHQCFMVGSYEPYVEACRRLGELSPCGGGPQRSLLVNSGAEAVENAVKIARAATGRPGVVVFEGAFHGRTLLALAMTANVKYKHGVGPLPPGVHRAPAPYPLRGVSSDDATAGLLRLFKTDVDPGEVACVVLEPVQGEGGFVPMERDFVLRLRELCSQHGILYVDDEVQAGVGRTGPVWAIEHFGVEPDLLVAGKSLGGGLPLASITGPADLMDALAPGGLGGTFGGNPAACAAACVVLDTIAEPAFQAHSREVGETMAAALDELAARHEAIGEHRGLGPMRALELREQTPELAAAISAAAFARGLVVLTCGIDGNVVRLMPPLTIADDELRQGLELLGDAVGDVLAR